MSASDKKPIEVYVRLRPLSTEETEQKKGAAVIRCTHPREIILKTGLNEKKYTFNGVFGPEVNQIDVFKNVVSPMIPNIISGYNCTVFAYGPTGTGKSHTIFGEPAPDNAIRFKGDSSGGLVLRTATHLFSELSKLSSATDYTVRVSMVEIYNEEVRDLFHNNDLLRIYEDPLVKGSTIIKDISKVTILNTYDLLDWLRIGLESRLKAVNNSNLNVNRSNVILTFIVNIKETTHKGEQILKMGRLHLIDLAGSENVGRAGATDVRAKDSGSMNRSIITLVKVIKALAQKMQHVPYRDSKLTKILHDSLGGNSRTAMIITCSPSAFVLEETLTNFELGQLAKLIINQFQMNVNKKPADVFQEIQTEIDRLRQELSVARSGTGFYISQTEYQQIHDRVRQQESQILQMVNNIFTLESHMATQEQQQINLTKSFAATKIYLETVEKMFIEKRNIVRVQKEKLNDLNVHHKQLHTETGELLTLCETTTTKEEVYFNKYQEKAATSGSNAELSNKTVTTTEQTFDMITKIVHEGLKHVGDQWMEIKRQCDLIREETNAVGGRLEDLRAMCRSQAKKFKLLLREVLEKGDRKCSIYNISLLIAKLYTDAIGQLIPERDGFFNLDNFNKTVQLTVAELQEESETITSQIQKSLFEERQFFTKLTETTSKQTYDRRLKELNEQIEEEYKAISYMEEQICKFEKEKKSLIAEAESLQRQLDENNDCINLKTNIDEQIHEIKQKIGEYLKKPQAALQDEKSVIANTMEIVNNNEQESCSKFENKNEIGPYVDQMIGATNVALQEKKTVVGRVSKNCERLIIKVLDDITENSTQITAEIDKVLAEMEQHQYFQADNVKKQVEKAHVTFDGIKDMISSAGPAGDTPSNTPVKRVRRNSYDPNCNGSPKP